jgi:hypothetical protein
MRLRDIGNNIEYHCHFFTLETAVVYYILISLICYILRAPPTSLLPNSHYEKLASAFGGNGYFATTQAELSAALKDIFSYQRSQPVIINVMIDTTSQRKSQEFFWMTKSNL